MKTVVTTLMAVAVLVLLAVPVVADWQEGDPYKWYQPPDLTDTGIDIYNVCPKILADDFLCTSPIPITDVHFWGSWKDDQVGVIQLVHLSIHSNVPADDQIPWSRPGQLLWQRDFWPGEFIVKGPIDSPREDWMNTNTGEYIPDNHNFAWQINIPNIKEPFLQEGTPDQPIIYWLDICVFVEGGEWGWKTSTEQWMDDAVWSDSPDGPWYPLKHPETQESLDLAFVITPEPGTISLLVLGGVAVLLRRRRK